MWSFSGARTLPGVVLLALAVACTDPSPPTTAEEATPTAAPAGDRYIVLLREGEGSLRATAAGVDIARLGGSLERAHAEIGVLQVRGLSAAAAGEVAKQPNVEAVVKDRVFQMVRPGKRRAIAGRSGNFGSAGNQRGAVLYAQFQWNLRQIRAPRGWDVSREGKGVTVCILDTGIDARHLDLRGKLNLPLSASFVAEERADRDLFSHGTDMASVITSNGIFMASVAPEARVCSVKVLDRTGGGTLGDIVAGIVYVGSTGAAVANMSFGVLLPRNDRDTRPLARALQRAINFSTRQGVLFVAAAGNEAADLNDQSLVSLPSDLDNVISVGATGPINQQQFDRVASYSNFGRRGVDVFAPGGEFAFSRNVLEDLILAACSPSYREGGSQPCAAGDEFWLEAGTSPSAAHVSGLAAVIESELPGDQSPAQLTACILQNADRLPRPDLTANGRINVLLAQDCGAPGNVAAADTGP